MFAFCNDESLELNDGFIISFFFCFSCSLYRIKREEIKKRNSKLLKIKFALKKGCIRVEAF